MRNIIAADIAQIRRIPQRHTFLDCAGQRGCFSPIPIEQFALVLDLPARLAFFGPEAEIERVKKQQPVDGALAAIVKMILLIPRWCVESSAVSFLLSPL